MANPVTRHAHSVPQIFDVLGSTVPPHVRQSVERFLSDRDRSIEDAVTAGLRKEISANGLGDNADVVSVFPSWTFASPLVSLIYEKQHDVSRLELAVACGGEFIAGGTVYIGAAIAPDDGAGTAAVVVEVARFAGGGTACVTGFASTVDDPLPHGRYLVALAVAVGPGDAWRLRGGSRNSIRVVESLY